MQFLVEEALMERLEHTEGQADATTAAVRNAHAEALAALEAFD